MEIIRTVTIPLIVKDHIKLREIAATAARFANEMISARYQKAKKLAPPETYTDYSDDLSAAVRDAVNQEVQAVWGKFAKQCLAGHRSLPIFFSGRSLSVRDRGVAIVRRGEGFDLSLSLLPAKSAERFIYPVYDLRLKKDLWLSGLLTRLAADEMPVLKANIIFDRRNPKRIAARVVYQKIIDPKAPGTTMTARLGPVGENGELYIRAEGRNQSLTHYVQRLENMKRNIQGVWQRVRLSKRRDAMKKLAHFEDWSRGPLHQMSASIVQFACDNKCAKIEWRIETAKELPWAQLKMLCTYKAREMGMEVVGEKQLLEKPDKETVKWLRQANKSIRELGQATRKM
jgi:hypothetical protein